MLSGKWSKQRKKRTDSTGRRRAHCCENQYDLGCSCENGIYEKDISLPKLMNWERSYSIQKRGRTPQTTVDHQLCRSTTGGFRHTFAKRAHSIIFTVKKQMQMRSLTFRCGPAGCRGSSGERGDSHRRRRRREEAETQRKSGSINGA